MRKRSVLRTGLVLGLVFAQAVAVATASNCACVAATMASMPSHAPTHQMPGMPDPGSHHTPCPHPMTPGTCGAMAACALVAIAAPTNRVVGAAPRVAASTVAIVKPPLDHSRGPEPPPPRA